ncbi:TonB family protein [Gluconacetobacter diazotrophicus PA1 5]|nr:TonB family protein [Gluconacetobacter diazotrophicus]ACI50551.1 TonB family protein [Gluconacetobacter diazotrophicus PA1 5]TWB09383.1 protein TonB [Gluconacetobacter diazotrophicus]
MRAAAVPDRGRRDRLMRQAAPASRGLVPAVMVAALLLHGLFGLVVFPWGRPIPVPSMARVVEMYFLPPVAAPKPPPPTPAATPPEPPPPGPRPDTPPSRPVMPADRDADRIVPRPRAMPSHAPRVARQQATVPVPAPAKPAPLSPPEPAAAPVKPVAPAPPAAPVCDRPAGRYPPMARRLHEEGEAELSLQLGPDGAVAHAELARSTGYDDLDEAALAAGRTVHCTVLSGRMPASARITVMFHLKMT